LSYVGNAGIIAEFSAFLNMFYAAKWCIFLPFFRTLPNYPQLPVYHELILFLP